MKLADATILVVDDEPFLRECFARWLKRRGCDLVFTAGNGVEALALVEIRRFDVLITDIHMPLMDGIQLLREIRSRGIAIPSIIFVGGYLEMDRAEMFELGVECMLAKPFLAESLLLAVETSVADRCDLWLTPMPEKPVQEVWIENVMPAAHAAVGSVRFGRGGFCASLTDSVGEGPVNFVITLDSDPKELRGEGYVRWYSAETQIGAVQFEYLETGSRERLLKLVAAEERGRLLACV